MPRKYLMTFEIKLPDTTPGTHVESFVADDISEFIARQETILLNMNKMYAQYASIKSIMPLATPDKGE